MTTWCMHIASWIPEATNTYMSCNNYCFSAAAAVARTRHIMHTLPVLLCFDICEDSVAAILYLRPMIFSHFVGKDNLWCHDV
jgi:hypothetical protein